ncbi:unnamed protein product [Gordionus sp. m RMFG-2023]
MVIVVRNDLKMGKGKLAAQCCHAAVECHKQITYKASNNNIDNIYTYFLRYWSKSGQPKIILKVESEKELLEIYKNSKDYKFNLDNNINNSKKAIFYKPLITSLICDAGKTQLDPGTYTVVGIGPAPSWMIDKITIDLKLL